MFEESPFRFVKAPDFIQPFTDKIYWLPITLSQQLDKELDQAIYFIGSFVAIMSCFILKQIKGETQRKLFSIATGMIIHFFVFGVSALASVT